METLHDSPAKLSVGLQPCLYYLFPALHLDCKWSFFRDCCSTTAFLSLLASLLGLDDQFFIANDTRSEWGPGELLDVYFCWRLTNQAETSLYSFILYGLAARAMAIGLSGAIHLLLILPPFVRLLPKYYRMVVCWTPWPTLHIFTASKSVDRQTLGCKKALIHGLWCGIVLSSFIWIISLSVRSSACHLEAECCILVEAVVGP